MIRKFISRYYFLSNYFLHDVTYAGIKYSSAETAFQCQKLSDYNEKLRCSRMSPSEARKMGRNLKYIPRNWNDLRNMHMRGILRAKFQDPRLKEWLLKTGDEELVEGNTWHDNYWGSCTCPRCGNRGKNMLGEMLMNLRGKLRNELENEPSSITVYIQNQETHRKMIRDLLKDHIDSDNLTKYEIIVDFPKVAYYFSSYRNEVEDFFTNKCKAGIHKNLYQLSDNLLRAGFYFSGAKFGVEKITDTIIRIYNTEALI